MLVYEMETVMPLEVEIPSLRVLINSELEEAEWAKIIYEELNLIGEKRLAAICHHHVYQMSHPKKYFGLRRCDNFSPIRGEFDVGGLISIFVKKGSRHLVLWLLGNLKLVCSEILG